MELRSSTYITKIKGPTQVSVKIHVGLMRCCTSLVNSETWTGALLMGARLLADARPFDLRTGWQLVTV